MLVVLLDVPMLLVLHKVRAALALLKVLTALLLIEELAAKPGGVSVEDADGEAAVCPALVSSAGSCIAAGASCCLSRAASLALNAWYSEIGSNKWPLGPCFICTVWEPGGNSNFALPGPNLCIWLVVRSRITCRFNIEIIPKDPRTMLWGITGVEKRSRE